MEENKKRRAPQHLKPDTLPKTKKVARPGKPPVQATAPSKAAGRVQTAAERSRKAQAASETARRSALFHNSLLPTVEHVHKMDQKGLKIGVTWLLLLPVLLLIIRALTDSNKVAFLIIWIIGMFVISAVLIYVAYTDHELHKFLEGVKQYIPEASDTELNGLVEPVDLNALPIPPETLREILTRRRSHSAGETDEESGEDAARLRLVEDWLLRLEQRQRKETKHAEHSADPEK